MTLTTDNGTQFTSARYVETLNQLGITHRRTAYNHPEGNSYIERFHRSLKEEEVWLNEYQNFDQAKQSIARWIEEYNHDRPHRGLHGRTPHDARARLRPNHHFKHGPMCLVWRGALQTLFLFLHLILQIMDSPCQFSEISRANRIFPFLEISYCALGDSGLAIEQLRGKLFRLCPNLVQIFQVDYSLVLAASLIRRPWRD